MIITADWAIPITRQPIRDGAVLIRSHRIADIGPADFIKREYPDEDFRHFPGCAIIPGMVNAHTHLVLTAMGGVIPPMPFTDWLPRLVRATHAWTHDDFAASATLGAYRCLEAGVTVVGDIAYGPESPSAAADAGLGGVFFWEVLGIGAKGLREFLTQHEFPSPPASCATPRLRCGLSPHAPYSSGPELIRAAHGFAREYGLPVMMHVAESPAEVDLLRDGTGPLADVARRLAPDFAPTGTGAVTYLDRLGALDGAIAVHLCQALPVDIPRLSATVAGVVVCPRSNRYLCNGTPPVERLLRAKVPIGLGTDSSASNEDLDIFEEMRALWDLAPGLTATQVLEIATHRGAQVLGMETRFGALEPDFNGDCVLVRIDPTDDPVNAVVRSGSRHKVQAVVANGIWRVLDGRLTFPIGHVKLAAARATQAAATALTSH